MGKDLLLQGLKPLRTQDRFLSLGIKGSRRNAQVILPDHLLEIKADSRHVPIKITLVDILVKQALAKLRGSVNTNLNLFCQFAKIEL